MYSSKLPDKVRTSQLKNIPKTNQYWNKDIEYTKHALYASEFVFVDQRVLQCLGCRLKGHRSGLMKWAKGCKRCAWLAGKCRMVIGAEEDIAVCKELPLSSLEHRN